VLRGEQDYAGAFSAIDDACGQPITRSHRASITRAPGFNVGSGWS
jgi:hypothetical protein